MFEKFILNKLEEKILTRNDFKTILTKKKQAVSFVNPFSYGILVNSDSIVDEVDVFFSDGSLLCALSNLRRRTKIDRVSFDFSSIADDVFAFAVNNKKRVALVGSTQDEVERAKIYFEEKYPNLEICLARNGYFTVEDFYKIANELNNSKANIVISGMGTPLQEQFIIYIRDHCLSVNLALTCGGFLTQTSMRGDYYHPIVKKLGLMWVQRCWLHKHVRQRLIKDYPLFVIQYLFNCRLR